MTLFAIALGASSLAWAEELSPGQALAARARAMSMSEPERVRSLAALPVAEREAFFRSLRIGCQ